MKNSKKTCFTDKLKSKLLSIDKFGQSVSFEINGDSELKTFKGAILSLILLSLILFYANSKMIILYTRGDTNHQTTVNVDGLITKELSAKEIDFNFAIGFMKKDWSIAPFDTTGILEVDVITALWDYDPVKNEIE